VAKLAHGLADNLLTACALAATCPVLVAPAMNDAMYEHPATQANLAVLRERGIHVLDPGIGALGSKHEWGVGRLPEPAELLAAVEAVVPSGTPRPWDGLRVLVTAGGTREPIDRVRFVGNRSSGRMGFALAEEAAALGADVTVVAANVALARHPRVRYVEVETAAELDAACREAFASCDVLLMAAAVADFRPAAPAGHKLKKAGRDELVVALEPTPDVLSGLAAERAPGQILVGFAAETGPEAVAYGRDKLARKKLDAVVVNDVGAPGIGFDAPDNEVTVITADGELPVPRGAKADVARVILSAVDRLRADLGSRTT
jgi:phosphopantothenoylcysteine decarboxylase/phosphopantothenate--cysteine ligase